MSKTIKLGKGLDIKLKGTAEKVLVEAGSCKRYAIQPHDFPGLIPKIAVKPDHLVKAGSVLFFDKYKPEIKFTSPVSGKVVAVERGERRRVLSIVVEADSEMQYESFKKDELSSLTAESVKETMLESGVWPFVRQRPYAVVANPADSPKAIFISGFDNAPLAPDYDFILKGQEKEFQSGIDALSKLTDGKIHLNVDGKVAVSKIYADIKGVEINKFIGKHPSSTVGTQINKIDPLNKGEIVWYVNPQDVIIIGRLFLEGKFDARRIVALAGSEVKAPKYYKTIMGASIDSLSNDQFGEGSRIISGNVLTGTKSCKDGFIGFYDSLISVIPEGNVYQFFGWLTPNLKKYSISRSYFSWLTPNKEYSLNTNYNGGNRAFVTSEEYEKVVPMDIYPVELVKACMTEDIDKMENLGIYEVAEEDLALCDYICSSKIEVQDTIRKGIDLMIKELS